LSFHVHNLIADFTFEQGTMHVAIRAPLYEAGFTCIQTVSQVMENSNVVHFIMLPFTRQCKLVPVT